MAVTSIPLKVGNVASKKRISLLPVAAAVTPIVAVIGAADTMVKTTALAVASPTNTLEDKPLTVHGTSVETAVVFLIIKT